MTRVFTLLVTVIATAFAALAGKPYPCYAIPLKAGMSIGMLLISVELVIMLLILLFIPGDYAGPSPRIAKVEVEQRALKVVRIESDIANAQLARAKEEVAAQESQLAAGESTKDELEAAKATLAQLTDVAQSAAARRERAELDAAEANVRRQQKLLALGSAHKSDVNRAQEKLAELKSPKN